MKKTRLLFISLMAALILIAVPLFSAQAQDKLPPPIDPQSWKIQEHMTWDDWTPNPVIDWEKDAHGIAPKRPLKGMLILVDFPDRPFISSLPLGAEMMGNPLVSETDRTKLAQFWVNFLNNPSIDNNFTTLNGYWLENSYGDWAVELDACGPYLLSRFEFQYGFYGNYTPTGFQAQFGARVSAGAEAYDLAKADGVQFFQPNAAGTDREMIYDFVFVLHSGYAQSGTWQEFGEMIFLDQNNVYNVPLGSVKHPLTGQVIPGLSGYDFSGEARVDKILQTVNAPGFDIRRAWPNFYLFNDTATQNAEFTKAQAADPELSREAFNAAYPGMVQGILVDKLAASKAEARSYAANPSFGWVRTRYIPWTSWYGGLGIWSGAGSATDREPGWANKTIPLSIQGENNGMGTFAHEFGHLVGLPDNYNNPYSNPIQRTYSGPWELMSRGSFGGPGGNHSRFDIPSKRGESIPSNQVLRSKLINGFTTTADIVDVTYASLKAGPVITEIVARNIPTGKGVTDAKGELIVGKRGIRITGMVDQTPRGGGENNTLAGSGGERVDPNKWNWGSFSPQNYNGYHIEVVERTGYDSFTPDHGVMITKTAPSGSVTNFVQDSHPTPLNFVDFVRPNGEIAMVSDGDQYQLASALFHAGVHDNPSYYREQYPEKFLAGDSRAGVHGDVVNEYADPFNKLHFYILDKMVNEGKYGTYLSYQVAVRSTEADAYQAGGALEVAWVDYEPEKPGRVAVAYVEITNTGDSADIIRVGAEGVLAATLLNNLYAIEAGATVTVPLYFELPANITAKDLADKDIIITASSETNGAKVGEAYIEAFKLLKYNFQVFCADTLQSGYIFGDTIYVDVFLQGDINYTQFNAALNYDAKLLEYAGYANLSGLAAEVKVSGNQLNIRSVPSLNMLLGTSCAAPVRIVTLKFKSKDSYDAKQIATTLKFTAVDVLPTAGVKALVAPGQPLTVFLQMPAGDFPVKVSYEGKWQDGLDAVAVEHGGRLALRAVYFTGDEDSPTGKISSDTAAVQSGKAIAFQWYQSPTNAYKGSPLPHAMGNDCIPDTGSTPPYPYHPETGPVPPEVTSYTTYYYAELTYTPDTAAPEVTEKYYSDIVGVTVNFNRFPTIPITPAEDSGWTRTTSSAEVYSYCQTVAAKSGGRIKMVDIGYTAGRSTPQNPSSPQPVPMLIIGNPAPASPAEVAADKAVALVECNIHSGEVEGKEAMLIFAREVALGLHDDMLEDLVILLVPNQNADGNDYLYKQRINSQYTPKMVGARFTGKDVNPYIAAGSYNATSESHNWYNGNRDMTKLDTPECTAVVKVMNEWDPVIFVDCHATNGSLMRHAVTFNWGLHPNTDAAIMDYNMGEFAVKSVGTDSYLYKVQGKTTQPYGNFSGGALLAGTTRWNSFEDYPRYTTNYAGLRNRLAMILEVYSHDPYTVRVDTQYACVYGILKAVAEDKVKIKAMIAAADKHAVERSVKGFDPAVDFVALNSRMDFLYDIKVETYLAAPTGSSPLSYQLRDDENDRCGTVYAGEAEYTIGYYGNWTPTERMPMGAYYLLDADCAEAVALLQKHGIKVDKLAAPLTIAAGDFQWFKATRRAQSATGSVYEGHLRNNFVGEWQTATAAQIFPAGAYVVTTSQTLGALAALLLEPAAVDGAITWNFFDTRLDAAAGTVRANYPSVTTDTGSPTYYLPVFKVTAFDTI